MFLQRMREKTQSWVAYVIVSLLVLSFAFWGISSYFSQNQSGGPVASVNGEDISLADFSSAYRNFLQSSYAQSQYFGQQETLAKQVVLKNLIERLAINHYLAMIGFAVSQNQIDAALMSVPLFSDNGVFSPALFKRFLVANNTPAQAFISDFSSRMVMAQWSQGLQLSSFSTQLELMDTISLLRQKRSILYTIIPSSSDDIPPISSEEVETYYAKHKEDYVSPERVKISYVMFRFTDLLDRVKPTEKELLSYYAQHSARYDKPERWQVKIFSMNSPLSESEIMKQIDLLSEKNDDLANLSTVKLVKEKVWLTADHLTRDVSQALAVTPLRHTTKLFKTGKDSYVVYFVLSHEAAINKQYSDVKKEVKEAYIHEIATQKWAAVLEEMSQLAYEHPDTLNPLAKHFNLQVHASDFFTENYDKKSGIQGNPEVIAAAFSDDVLKGGNNSDLIKLNEGKSVVVLRISTSIPENQQTLQEVSDGIKALLIKEKATQRAKQSADQLKQALEENQSIKDIQKRFGVILTKALVGRFSDSIPNEILQQSFVLSKDHITVAKMENNNFAVVKVLSIIPGKISTVSNKDKTVYRNVIENELAQAELFAYVQAIIAGADIEILQKELKVNT